MITSQLAWFKVVLFGIDYTKGTVIGDLIIIHVAQKVVRIVCVSNEQNAGWNIPVPTNVCHAEIERLLKKTFWKSYGHIIQSCFLPSHPPLLRSLSVIFLLSETRTAFHPFKNSCFKQIILVPNIHAFCFYVCTMFVPVPIHSKSHVVPSYPSFTFTPCVWQDVVWKNSTRRKTGKKKNVQGRRWDFGKKKQATERIGIGICLKLLVDVADVPVKREVTFAVKKEGEEEDAGCNLHHVGSRKAEKTCLFQTLLYYEA